MADQERKPLLSNQAPVGVGSIPVPSAPLTSAGSSADRPPSYAESQGAVATQTAPCDVCHKVLRFSNNATLVKCPDCKQHTAMKPPPPGKRYFRCGECSTLSKCNVSVHAVKCPKCQHITKIGPPPPGKKSGNCYACDTVLLYPFNAYVVRCTRCLARNVTDRSKLNRLLLLLFLVGFLLIGIGVGVTVATFENPSAGLYVACYGPIVAGVMLWVRGVMMRCMYGHSIRAGDGRA